MIKFITALLTMLLIQCVCYSQPATLHQVDPLEKIFKERVYYPDLIDDTIYAAAGETASLQFVLKAKVDMEKAKIFVDRITGPSALSASARWITYVPVGRSYYGVSKDRIISESGYFPDPIVDDTTLKLSQGEINPLWVTVPIPVNTVSGIYKGKVSVSFKSASNVEKVYKNFVLKIYPVKIPETSLLVSNWSAHFNAGIFRLLNKGVAVKDNSPLYWDLVKLTAEVMGAHNQNVVRMFPLWRTEVTMKDGKYNFDFKNFDKEVQVFKDAGALKFIEGGQLAWRSGAWDDPFYVELFLEDNDSTKKLKAAPNLNKVQNGLRAVLLPISDQRAKNFLSQYLPALKKHLEDKGWLSMYMQHIADEPTSKNSPSYVEIGSYVKKYLPGVKILEAVLTSKELKDIIDVWVPVLDVYHKDYKFYQELKLAGKDIWFYTCVVPQNNYANRFIELPLLQTRYLHWINYKYGSTGYLHWGLNFWGGNDPLRDDASRNAGKLPAGDANIIYPGYRKIYSSIRFETMRDGIYDYELLKLLEKKNPQLAKSIVGDIILNFNEYDGSIRYFRQIRKKILETLSN